MNVRSIVNKVGDIQNWLSNNPYDLLGLSETWLTEEHSDNLFSIKGYRFERRDRSTHGGGVGCFISEKYSYVRRLDLESVALELMWLELQRTNSRSFFVGILYRKPNNQSDFFENLEQNLEKLYTVTNNVILLGDFNCNMLTDSSLSRKVHTLCTTMQMTQVISQSTRVTPYSQSLIDLICISDSLMENVIKSGVQIAGISDHSVIYTVLKGKYQPLSPKISKFRSFKHFDSDRFREDVGKIDWHEFYSCGFDVENLWHCFKSTLLKICDRHAPIISVRQKQRGVPWINGDYIKLARQRDFCRKQFKKTGLISWWHKFQYFRNKANNLNKHLKKMFYQDKFQSCGNDIKKNWNVLSKLIPKKNKVVNEIKVTIGDDQVPSEEIANVLNKAFNEVSLRLQNPSGNASEETLNSLQTLFLPTCEFKFSAIKNEFVVKELLNIDCSKAMGVDRQ